MADEKLTALTELTTLATGDLVYVVDDPGGTPLSKKATIDNLLKNAFADMTFNGAFHPIIAPGSDTDAVLVEVTVTGTPQLNWDESADAFSFSKPLRIDPGEGGGNFKLYSDNNDGIRATLYVDDVTPYAAFYGYDEDDGGSPGYADTKFGAITDADALVINAANGTAVFGSNLVTTFSNTALHILDTNASHDLIIAPGSDLTADRTLTLTTGDAARTITLSGNPTLADWFDQSVKQAASPTFAGLDLTEGNITNVGDISLDSLTSDGSTITIGGTPSIVLTDGTTVAVTLGNDAGDDFTIDTSAFVVEGDTGNVGIGTTSPSEILHIESATDPTLVITNADANQSDGGKISFREANAIERFNIEYDGSTNRLKFVSENVGDVLVMEKATGSVLIGDTANANMTQGLTINQGANDDEIFALKSSDVAHGVTDFAETDTFALFKKAIPTQGGFQFWSFMETGQNGAIQLIGVDTDDNTSKTSGARAPVEAYAYKKSGTSVGALGANANAFVIRDAGGAIFLVDEDGDYHYDGADGGAFDHMNDVQLVRAFSLATSADVIRTGFDDFVQYNESDLIEAGILGAPVADGGLVNGAQLQRLHTGAIWQLGTSQMQLEQRIEQLETALLDAGMEIPQLQ